MTQSCWLASLLVAAALACAATFVSAEYNRTLFIFGDSLSDVGRFKALTLGLFPPDTYWEGRFSNGPVWCEYTALLQQAALNSSAVGGASTQFIFPMPFGEVSLPGISTQDQIDNAKTEFADHGMRPKDSDIAMLVVGSNDVVGAAFAIKEGWDTASALAERMSDAVVSQLQSLEEVGFSSIFVTNLPQVQIMPLLVAANLSDAARGVVAAYNPTMATKVSAWAADSNVSAFSNIDIEGFLDITRQNSVASALHFNDIDSACVGGSLMEMIAQGKYLQALIQFLRDPTSDPACADPESHFFWDIFHPTDRVHRLFGYYANEVINARLAGTMPPAPTSDLLLGLISKYALDGPVAKPAAI